MISLAFVLIVGGAEAQLACHPEQGQHALVLLAGGRLQAGVDELSFRPSPFVPERLACERWLASVPPWSRRVSEPDMVPLLNPGSAAAVRLSGVARRELYDACARSPFCSLRPPFSFLGMHWFAGRFDEAASVFGDRVELCTTPTKPRAPLVVSPSPVTDVRGLSAWLTPRDTLGGRIRELLEPGATVLASAMTLSAEELRDLHAVAKRRGARVVLLFDLNAAIDQTAELARFDERSGALLPLPIFSRPDRPRYFHVKGAVRLDQRSRVVIGSPNLKGYERTRLVDVGLSGVSQELGPALANALLREAEASCAAPALLECTLDVAFAFDRDADVHRRLLANACAALRPFAQEASPLHLLATGQHDVLSFVVKRVQEAARRVEIVTHRFERSPLTDALMLARKRGVRVEVQVGSEAHQETIPEELRDVVSIGPLRNATQVHAKMMRADDSVIVGSGNFTRGGLAENDEIFFESAEPEISQLFTRVLGELRALRGLPPVPHEVSGADALVWLDVNELDHLPPEVTLSEDDPLLRGRFHRATGAVAACLQARGARVFYDSEDLDACIAPRR